MSHDLPKMEPLAPIFDQMRALARKELPGARTGHVKLWDDGTFLAVIFHSMGEDGKQAIRYEPATSEIVWEHVSGYRLEADDLSGGETLLEPEFENHEIRAITTVEPPYE